MLADGEQLGDHWLLNKDGFFDQSYHIPLIVKAPTAAGLPGLAAEAAAAASALAGTVVEAFTEHVDILPSILEFVGLSVPPQADGRSLLPFLLAQPTPHSWRSAAHWEFDCKCIRSLCVFSKRSLKRKRLRRSRSQPARGLGGCLLLALRATRQPMEVRVLLRPGYAPAAFRHERQGGAG